MYLFFFEDLAINKSDTVTEHDLICVANGYMDIIDISGDEPLRYTKGQWKPVDECEPQELDE